MARKAATRLETENKVFAKRLRELMKERGLNQSAIASKIGCQRQTISNYTAGQSNPDCEMLAKIATALNVSADYLIGISNVKTLDADVKAICNFLGLSETTVLSIRKDMAKGEDK